MAYPLGWSVVPQMVVRRERWSGRPNTKSVPLVLPGQEVQPDQPVIRLEPYRTASTKQGMQRNVVAGLGSARAPAIVPTPAITPETIPAGLRGRVIDITRRGGIIIESRAAVIQGAIGAGNQVAGLLTIWQSRGQQQIPAGALLVIPGPLNFAMLHQAISSGIAGVIASSISSYDLEGFLQTDLVQLLNSIDGEAAQANLPPMTLLLTEGLGTTAMPARTINLLSQYQGSIALLSGTTSVRQGILPELIISLPIKEARQNWHPVQPDPTLAIGAQVRVCAGNYEGVIGEINHIFVHQQVFPSGVRSRAVRLGLEDGSMLVVPITLIERIG